jgi:hypothetical protein
VKNDLQTTNMFLLLGIAELWSVATLGFFYSVNISRMASLLTRIVQEYRPPSLAKKAQ